MINNCEKNIYQETLKKYQVIKT